MSKYKIKDIDPQWLEKLNINQDDYKFQWYIITIISGNEQKVIKDLENKIKGYGETDKIKEIKIIKAKVKEEKIYQSGETPRSIRNRPNLMWETIHKDGQTMYKSTKIKEENKFNGYVFIKADMTEKLWFIIRNTQMVTGIVGSSGKNTKPIPVDEAMINKIIEETNASNSTISLTLGESKNEVQSNDIHTIEQNQETQQYIEHNFKVGMRVIVKDNAFAEKATIVSLNDQKQQATIEFEFFGRMNSINIPYSDIKIEVGS